MNNVDGDGLQQRVDKALNIAVLYAHCAGDDHRLWVIDQMIRALTGPNYKQWVAQTTTDEHGNSYPDLWDVGTVP